MNRHKEQLKKQPNSRGLAGQIVSQWLKTSDFPERLLESYVFENRAFIMELVYGIVRWKRALEWITAEYVHRMPTLELKALIFVGLYQILFMTNVDAYAAVNETVNEVKNSCSGHGRQAQGEANFVNAILRRVLREKESIIQKLHAQPIGIQQSHSDCLVERWNRHFGEKATQHLCKWNNNRPNAMIRINHLKTTRNKYLSMLNDANIKILPNSAQTNEWLSLAHGTRIKDLPGYQEGYFLILDPSTGMAVDLLNPQPGNHVLDACAAPGGKTFLIAERMQKQGQLKAIDLYQDRISRLMENLKRLGCDDFVDVIQGDAEKLIKTDSYDRILLDVPCTNTGVIRRKPDIRWRFSENRLAKINNLQRTILGCGLNLLKPGGQLVYSTCSLEPEENEYLISKCLTKRTDIHLVEERKTFPPVSKTDGVYVALLQKT